MHLPDVVARCEGAEQAICRICRRRVSGDIPGQRRIFPSANREGCPHFLGCQKEVGEKTVRRGRAKGRPESG